MSTSIKIPNLSIKQKGAEVKIAYDIPVLTKVKDGVWYATCPLFKSLGYSTVSEEAAVEDQHADVRAFIAAHLKNGSLERALSRLGWARANKASPFEILPSSIPLELLRNSQNHHRSYAAFA